MSVSHKRLALLAVLPLLLGYSAYAQSSSLTLASGSAAEGASVSLNLSLNAASGSMPSALQWTFSYSASDVTVTVAPGAALNNAGKTVSCNTTGGTTMCLATGLNSNTIASGVVAIVTAKLATYTSSASVPIGVGSTMGVLPNGSGSTLTGTGGTISVQNWVPVPVPVKSLTCSPLTIMTPGTSACTVTLTGAAPSGGAVVKLSSSNGTVSVPASVTVPSGSSSANFTASAASVSSTQTVVLTATLSTSATVSLTLQSSNTVSGLVAAYGFSAGSGSTVPDASGNGYTGQIQGATWTTAGKYGDALSFNGTSSYVDLGNPSLLKTTGSMSWSAWVMATGNPPDDGQIIAQSDNSGGWQLKTSPDTGSRTFAVGISSGSGPYIGRYSKTVVALNTWYYVTGVYNAPANTLDIYVNGVLDDGVLRGTVPSSQSLANVNANIGRRAGGYYFDGVIDEVRVYNVPLTAPQIQSDMITSVGSGSGNQPVVSALQCNPGSLTSGSSSTCTATLSQAAPSGGAGVALSSNSTALTVPASVTVASGSSSANFIATAGTVTATKTVTVTASLNGKSASASLSVQPFSPTPGLISAYGFNEDAGSTVYDSSGYGNTGNIHGSTWTTGKFGTALSFNGNGNYIDLGQPASLKTTGSMTWSAWVRATGNPPDDGQIVAQSNDNSGWQFKTSPDTGPRTFAIAVSPNSSSLTQRYSKTVLALNTWYYVAGVYNAAAQTLDIYVNGVLDDGALRGTVPGSQYSPSINATIGQRSGGYYFNGTIDEVRIYGAALTAAQIQSDMNTPVGTSGGVVTRSVPVIPASVGEAAATLQETDHAVTNLAGTAQLSLSGLSCNPRTAAAGSQVTCELRTSSSSTSLAVQLATSSLQVRVPATVLTRPNQSSLTFLASVEPLAGHQSVVLSATSGSAVVRETVLVTPSSAPVLQVPAKQLAKWGTPAHFDVAAIDPAGLPVQLKANGLPSGAAFDPSRGRFDWTPNATQAGSYPVTFTATNSARQSSSAEVSLEVDSGRPVLTPSDQLACSPGSIASLSGKWLAEPGSVLSDASGNTTNLGGTQVSVNGAYAPLLYASSEQVKFLCPAQNSGAQLSVAVENHSAASNVLLVPMREASPIIQGAISFADSTDLVMQRSFLAAAHPAQPGDSILIWASGLSPKVEPESVRIKFGDAYATADSIQSVSGYVGVYRIQVRVPAVVSFGDQVPVQIQLALPEGQFSSNLVTAAIEPVRE